MKRYNFLLLKEDYDSSQFHTYIKRVPMLKTAVEILKILSQYGKAYIVGGSVRDIILGKDPHDVDIATNVPMEKIESLFETYDIGKNKDFGIVVIKHNGFDFEIAQFRQDGNYTDGRRPETVTVVPNFEDDAARRDFTINAMAIDSEGNIIDFFDGQHDIKNKVLKTVGDPEKRFKEDYLRMLRAVRFSSKLGFNLNPETKQAIIKHAGKLSDLSAERIYQEVIKMAEQEGGKFADAIIMLDEVGLLQHIFPEIVKLKEFHHEAQHHPEGNPFQHTIAALRTSNLADPILNLAILFHDVGKTETYKNIDGKHTYFGHAEKSSEIIDRIANRLKLPNTSREALKFVAIHHMKMHNLTSMKKSKVLKMMADPNWKVLFNTAMADAKARGEEFFHKEDWNTVVEYIKQLSQQAEEGMNIDNLRKIVNGKLVMDVTGIKGGKQVGEIITKTIEWITDNNIDLNDMTKIITYIRDLSIMRVLS